MTIWACFRWTSPFLAVVCMASPVLGCVMSTPDAPETQPSAEARAVFEQARQAEKSDPRRAIALYMKAVDMKNGYAAKRLGDIYDRGVPGVPRDYQAMIFWWNTANRLGVNAPKGCNGGR